MLLVPLAGAVLNVSVVPETVYVFGAETAVPTITRISLVDDTERFNVNAVVEPLPLKNILPDKKF
jgi:hypothetical protein